jgi:hypothetical protein
MDRTVNHLASYGRHGDDTLLHVSRKELEGIRQLTGKGFTTNPHTGLPEAFNWAKAILPAIAGIGITALTGGLGAPAALAALAGAAGSGATSFGVGKAQGESTSQALQEGLISGATSFAGGQLLSGVGGAAGSAVEGTASGLGSTVANSAENALAQGVADAGQAGTSLSAAGGLNPAAEAAINATPSASMPATASTVASAPMAGSAASGFQPSQIQTAIGQTAEAAKAAPSISGSLSDLGGRISNVASDPGAAASQVWRNVQSSPFSALTAAGGLYSSLTSPSGASKMPRETPYDPSKYPEQFPTNPQRATPDPYGYVPGVSGERRYFAKGGLSSMRAEEGMTANIVNEAKAALLNEHPRPKEALARFEGMFGSGALSLLRDKIAGGRIRGAGGGMDDLIPGSIEGRQQVRLADGEFVVPADVVSGLGDGSTDQGVRRLHEMMNTVRKQRTGKEAQPKSIGGKITL